MRPTKYSEIIALNRAGKLSESTWRRYQDDQSDPRHHEYVPEKWGTKCYRCGWLEAAHHGRLWSLLRWAGLLGVGCWIWWCAFQAVA